MAMSSEDMYANHDLPDNYCVNDEHFFNHSNKRKRKPSAPQRIAGNNGDYSNPMGLFNHTEPINLINRGHFNPTISQSKEQFTNNSVSDHHKMPDQELFHSMVLNYISMKYPNIFDDSNQASNFLNIIRKIFNPTGQNSCVNQENSLEKCSMSSSNSSSASPNAAPHSIPARSEEVNQDSSPPNLRDINGFMKQQARYHHVQSDSSKDMIIAAIEACMRNVPTPKVGSANYEALLFCYKTVIEKAYLLKNSLEIYFSLFLNSHEAFSEYPLFPNGSIPQLDSTCGSSPFNASQTQHASLSRFLTERHLLPRLFQECGHSADSQPCTDSPKHRSGLDGGLTQNKSTRIEHKSYDPVDLSYHNFGVFSMMSRHNHIMNHQSIAGDPSLLAHHGLNDISGSHELLKNHGLDLSLKDEDPKKTEIQDDYNAMSSEFCSTVDPSKSIWSCNSRAALRQRKHCYTKTKRAKRLVTMMSSAGTFTDKTSEFQHKKSNFRGTSEEENLVAPDFRPTEVNGQIILSEAHPNVKLSKDIFYSLIVKSSGSATRLIRLLMKSFFTQDELAASSLSGEGIYKQRLEPSITEAIKLFIRKRHPQLKTGSINLCMTDVCVQARRVANNQRSRQHPLRLNCIPSEDRSNPSSDCSMAETSRAHSAPQSSPFGMGMKSAVDDEWKRQCDPIKHEVPGSIWSQASRLGGIICDQAKPGSDQTKHDTDPASEVLDSAVESQRQTHPSPELCSDSSSLNADGSNYSSSH